VKRGCIVESRCGTESNIKILDLADFTSCTRSMATHGTRNSAKPARTTGTLTSSRSSSWPMASSPRSSSPPTLQSTSNSSRSRAASYNRAKGPRQPLQKCPRIILRLFLHRLWGSSRSAAPGRSSSSCEITIWTTQRHTKVSSTTSAINQPTKGGQALTFAPLR
jgi:hypothetical protein